MKIYTKKGDKGATSLIGGAKVPKSNLRIHAYGTIDELNSFIGIVRDSYPEKHSLEILYQIQNLLFTIGSNLAADPDKSRMQLPTISEDDIMVLEHEIDNMTEKLPPLTHFILPGGHIASSHCHVARCVCRRSERLIVELSEKEKVDPLILKYINRLSDYLFVLSRKILADNNAEEIKWVPEK